MIARWALAFGLLGLLLAGFFLRRGPSFQAVAAPCAWTTGPLDAGTLGRAFALGELEFLRATDAEVPVLGFAVIRRGEQHLAFDDFDFFHGVLAEGPRLWVLGESSAEGPGPSLELLVSEDDGRSFEHRASIPKPNYQAMFESWTVSGDTLRLELSLDDEAQLHEAWLWPWWRRGPLAYTWLEPSAGAGRWVLASKDGGRRWRLEPAGGE